MKRVLIVGAGLSGSTVARVLADHDFQVDILEKRGHIGGNVYDLKSEDGIRYHFYGPHLFHTNNKKVVDFLSRFTGWSPYRHKVMALNPQGELIVFPLTESEKKKYRTKEEILNIYYRPYSKKMWGRELEELHPSVLNRIRDRVDDSEYYFLNDSFQAIPDEGYTSMVDNMLMHPKIFVHLNTPFHHDYEKGYEHIFYSGSIDEYFHFKLGILPYRSIKFRHVTYPISQLLPVMQVNYTVQSIYTRMTDWAHLPENADISLKNTILTSEEPCNFIDKEMERYYPIEDVKSKNRALYQKYVNMVPENLTLIGRLGHYAYLDMDQAVSSALQAAYKFLKNRNE